MGKAVATGQEEQDGIEYYVVDAICSPQHTSTLMENLSWQQYHLRKGMIHFFFFLSCFLAYRRGNSEIVQMYSGSDCGALRSGRWGLRGAAVLY